MIIKRQKKGDYENSRLQNFDCFAVGGIVGCSAPTQMMSKAEPNNLTTGQVQITLKKGETTQTSEKEIEDPKVYANAFEK